MNFKTTIFILLVLAPSISMAKVNVMDYGAKADGKTDDTAAIQRTLDATAKDRGCSFNDKAKGEGWTKLCAYLEQNLEGFRIGQTDWEYMSGCFNEKKPQLRVDAKAVGVTISGCRLQGGERFEFADEAKKNVQAGLNVTR